VPWLAMRLDTEFIRLPLRVDSERLTTEVAQLPESAWRAHPQGFAGNSAIALVAASGDPERDDVAGPMRATPHLATCPYLRQVLASFSAVLGRTRLMRLEGNAEAIRHTDTSYYWFDRARVHVPVVTHPDVIFRCGERGQHMAAGDVWIFNTWQPHRVLNPRPTERIHLVADTIGSAAFWSLADAGDHVYAPDRRPPAPAREIAYDVGATPELHFENWNWPSLMAPAQLEAIVAQIRSALPADAEQTAILERTLLTLAREWRGLWARHGDARNARSAYRDAREQFGAMLAAQSGGLVLENGSNATRVLEELLLRPLVSPNDDNAESQSESTARTAGARPRASQFDRPIFIVCPPRSGSSLLFETLSRSPDLWSVGGESHRLIESIPALHPASHEWESNRLTAEAASDAVVSQLSAALARELRDRDGARPADATPLRLLEKTPKNALRVPFLAAAFPDAYFVYLYRDPHETLSSMLDAWRSGRFVTYPDLPGWRGPAWSLLLTPGWRELVGRPLQEIVAQQWTVATDLLLDDLESLAPERWCVAAYDRLVADARAEVDRICGFLRVRWDRPLDEPLPMSRTTLTSPNPDKWRRNASELEAMIPAVRDVATRARLVFGKPPATRPGVTRPTRMRPEADGGMRRAGELAPTELDFRSSYTPSFAQLLQQLGATLLVTTYQSGRVILVRADGDRVNTHLRAFPSPMGIALAPGRLALGTRREVWEFFDMPSLAAKLEPADKHDAVYVPRSCAVTGDIRVHELAYVNGELWATNTLFSALCTLDHTHSFIPRWRPPFVRALAPEDRCHLNGICVTGDRIRFVTVLGQSDAKGGWRETRAAGGCILEYPSGRAVVEGLSMPHSPRWHDGALWVLESGNGEIGSVDLTHGRVVPIAQLEGFTRGLAFAGSYAFVGLSQVRESNVFGGTPLTERASERKCGVWVIDTRTGKTAGFLRFEGSVQEIFDIQILHGARYAELLEPSSTLLDAAYALAPGALAEVPDQLRGAR